MNEIAFGIVIMILAALTLMGMIKTKKRNDEFKQWLDKRVATTQKEYDSILKGDPDFNIKIAKGGKLTAYKEVREYINSHDIL